MRSFFLSLSLLIAPLTTALVIGQDDSSTLTERNTQNLWKLYSGPPACTDTNKRSHCTSIGKDCNQFCICIPWQGCGAAAEFFCLLEGGYLDDKCTCHKPTHRWHPRDLRCPSPLTACSLDATPSAHSSYECIDTTSTLDSCGGCVFQGQGQDCTSIEGADEVSCIKGSCQVSSCLRGWEVNGNGTSCERSDLGSVVSNGLRASWRVADRLRVQL
ncbi:hypothetical protein M231_07009 [Tremella mesenterica]|uniref:Protein CPL1-like domain-containing protein n=1 Tax=Tremella mesenterica TaxID=5217 RepID=A0A4V1M358_TREME|nr:hypothetical protein M231_07009 [Tremella mesenterica]